LNPKIAPLRPHNPNTERPSKKLDLKQVGPFEILQEIGHSAYRLKLPASIKSHPVYHTSLLRLDPENPLLGQVAPPPEPVIVNDQEEYIVTKILDSQFHYGRLQYRVAWRGTHLTLYGIRQRTSQIRQTVLQTSTQLTQVSQGRKGMDYGLGARRDIN
jgi:hypothetical protein